VQGHPEADFAVEPGSLVSVDISGFTSLSEQLQARGRVGAEELTLLVGGVFDGLVGVADRHGGDVLKFRGDALLLFFNGAKHERRACQAASEMHRLIERTGGTMSSVGPIKPRMAIGAYSGECHFFLVRTTHHELIVTGPAATAVVKLESGAESGDVLVSSTTAASLEPDWLVGERDGAVLVEVPPGSSVDPRPAADALEGDLEHFVPQPLRKHLQLRLKESEHRTAAVSFLRFAGVDRLLREEGPAPVFQELQLLATSVGNTAAELGVMWLESDVDVDGGKLYLVAGAPSSAGEDEERVLRTLKAVFDAPTRLTLSAGTTRGPVFAGDIGAINRRTYAVMGDTVNLAARLTAKAEPGQILALADVL